LGQNGTWPGPEAPNSSGADVEPPAKRRDLTHTAVHPRNVVSPSSPRQGKRAARRADGAAGRGGGSKRRPTCNGPDRGCATFRLALATRGGTASRKVATSPHAQAGRLPSGVDGREQSANRRRKQCRSVGAVATTVAGAASTTEVISVVGTASVTSRLAPRPMGQPRATLNDGALSMHEPDASQGARPVLGGGGAGNSSSLPDRHQGQGP